MYSGKLVMRLEDEIRKLEVATFDFPPSSYDKFMEAVGKRNGLKKAIITISESIKEDDEL